MKTINNTIYDKIFITSYVKNSDKRKKISKYLKEELNINNFEFVYGIDPYISNFSNINLYDKNSMDYPYHYKEKISNGYICYHNKDISNTLNQLSLLLISKYENYEKILILQDDCHFLLSPSKILQYFNEIPLDADIVHYGYINHFNGIKFYNNLYDESIGPVAGNQCYAICNKNAINKIIDSQYKTFCVDDQFFYELNLKIYIASNKIATDPNFI